MLRRLLAFATVLTLAAGSASATTEIRVSSSPAGTSNCISAPETNQLINFHVVVFSDVPLSSVSFSVVIPPALIWIDDTPDFAATTGNSPTGTTITFGGCQSGPIHVMTVRCVVSVFDPPDCQFALVQDALALDCDGQAVTVSGGTSRVVPGPCEISGPSNPSPPDHAQDVPLNSLLAWTGEGAHTCVLGEVIYYSLYFGSDPNPPLSTQQVAFPGMTPPHPLAPGTQYYWRVLATQYGYNSSLSPVWTFRTAGPVPTQASTWGRIKSLYRR